MYKEAKMPSSQNTQWEYSGYRICSLELSLLYCNPRDPSTLSLFFSQRSGNALTRCWYNEMSMISVSFFHIVVDFPAYGHLVQLYHDVST